MVWCQTCVVKLESNMSRGYEASNSAMVRFMALYSYVQIIYLTKTSPCEIVGRLCNSYGSKFIL